MRSRPSRKTEAVPSPASQPKTRPRRRPRPQRLRRVGILSDVHAHRHDQDDAVSALIEHINGFRDLDLLLCAGDISDHTREVRGFLDRLVVDCPRAWVPGNHDLWVIDAETEDDSPEYRYRVVFPALSKEVGWHYLPAQPLLLPTLGIAVVGTLGWFSGPGFSEWFDTEADERDELLARSLAESLEGHVLSVPAELKVIVVTHHAAHPDSVPEADRRGGICSYPLRSVVARHAHRLALVVQGHKHRRFDPLVLDGVRFVAHPFGYPHQHSRVEDGFRVVEIDCS